MSAGQHILSSPLQGDGGYYIECSCGYKSRCYWLPYQCQRPARTHQRAQLKKIEEAIGRG